VPHIVLVDEPDEEGNHDCILSDGFDGALQATRHLLELGHRRIAFLLGDAVPTFRERYHGYICAFHDAGLAPDPRLTMEGEITPNCRLVDILRGPDRATGLIVANDWHALAAMKICNEMGLSIPGDVSIIGFDDIEFSSHAVPPLSTVRVDKEYMGRLAVRRIQFRLAEDRLNPEPAILIKTAAQLVLRESCGPPPSHG
jgi:LacI family transcriptional regulator